MFRAISRDCPSDCSAAAPSILILGYGAFGRLAARMLAPHARVTICDPDPAAQARAQQAGLALARLEQAGGFGLVILAMPVPALEPVLTRIAPHLRPGQVVSDVCSVKEGPALLMQRILPADVQILATHPLFGPQSLGQPGAPARIVLCPLRGTAWRRIAAFLRARLGLNVILSTPQEHDRHAALTQGLTHLLARAMAGFQPHPRIRTHSFDLMMQALAMVSGDAPEVFAAVTEGNPHVAVLRDRLTQSLLYLAIPA
ncbi:MAG: prephenate dehydrogenase [Paracoccus sp. (in: a-proteobacteria)]|uniref:prephenate dehydrogenase/arogenate dehydrogenase family protein n=1 Tax=Paracoccus sp. TaxID=267 RepID=UPI0039E602C0